MPTCAGLFQGRKINVYKRRDGVLYVFDKLSEKGEKFKRRVPIDAGTLLLRL